MNTKIFDRLDPDLLMKCYSKVTKPEKIHAHFNKMIYSQKEDRVQIYQTYVSLMLPKCMAEKGHGGLQGWKGTTGGRLRTSGGNCNYRSKLIQIADWMIESDITKFDDLHETILHEIAHANAWLRHGEGGHGPIWQREAKLIGCTGLRCMPNKFIAAVAESAIYKCKSLTDKCIVVKSGSKKALTMFSKKAKMPTFICKKHRLQLDFIEIKAYEPKAQEKLQKLEQFRQQHGISGLSFGNNNEVVEVEDGDVIDVDEDGEVSYAEPEICLKYD
jgi:hypothetical protein